MVLDLQVNENFDDLCLNCCTDYAYVVMKKPEHEVYPKSECMCLMDLKFIGVAKGDLSYQIKEPSLVVQHYSDNRDGSADIVVWSEQGYGEVKKAPHWKSFGSGKLAEALAFVNTNPLIFRYHLTDHLKETELGEIETHVWINPAVQAELSRRIKFVYEVIIEEEVRRSLQELHA